MSNSSFDAGAERRDDAADLFVREDLVEPRLLDVEDLAADREDRLIAAVATLLGAAACRVALDDVDLAESRIVVRAIGELPGQRTAVEDGLAPRELPRLARRLAGARRRQHLVDDLAGHRRVLLEVLSQALADDALDHALDLAVSELGLGLTLELRVLHLHRDHRGQAFAHVLARHSDLRLGGEAFLVGVVGERAGERRAEADQMGAALDRVDVVHERVHRFGVAVVVLERHLDRGAVAVTGEVHRLRVEHLFVLVDVLHELDDPALVEVLLRLVGAFVGEADRQRRCSRTRARACARRACRTGIRRPRRSSGRA